MSDAITPKDPLRRLHQNLPPVDGSARYSIPEAAAYLGLSRATIYKDIQADKLATIKDRKRRFVPGSEIIRRSRVD